MTAAARCARLAHKWVLRGYRYVGTRRYETWRCEVCGEVETVTSR